MATRKKKTREKDEIIRRALTEVPPVPTVSHMEADALLRVLWAKWSEPPEPGGSLPSPVETFVSTIFVISSLAARVASLEAARLLATRPRPKKRKKVTS